MCVYHNKKERVNMAVKEHVFFTYVGVLKSVAESKSYEKNWNVSFSRDEIEEAFTKVKEKQNGMLQFPEEELYKNITPLIQQIDNMYEQEDISDSEFCERVFQELEELQNSFRGVNFFDLPKEMLYNLGFGNWDNRLLLIPLYVFPTLPYGTKLTSISNETKIVGKDYIDNDNRYGCIAYGFPSSLFDEK